MMDVVKFCCMKVSRNDYCSLRFLFEYGDASDYGHGLGLRG